MNKKRKSDIADLVKSGKTGKEAYEATKKGGGKTATAKTSKKKTAKKATKK